MRLWHVDLIPYLPKSQLLAQWRELNSIFVKQDKHILINYIYNYDKKPLLNYSQAVMREMRNRGYRINSYLNYQLYFLNVNSFGTERFKEHNAEYLTICYYNLKEKYLRGQKDFTDEIWGKLDTFYGEQDINTYLFDTREKAVAKLKELRDNFAKENDLSDYNVDMDTEDEFDCYEQGFYNGNRYVLYILEQGVE